MIPIQEKGRRVPIHIQPKVGAEIKKLISEVHIVKLDECTSDQFVAPVVVTAKKDGTVKLAMDAKPMNVQIFKNKFQMPNLLELLDPAAQVITSKDPSYHIKGLSVVFCFLDDLLIVSKCSILDHNKTVENLLERPDDEGFAL